jgi:NAD(P)-dependent dehydrogenase (short-subunit alcohol dehydrogenase family)
MDSIPRERPPAKEPMPMNEEAHTANARVSVVTGATGMLGRATAIELAARGAGVVLVCRDPAGGARVLEEVRKAGPAGSHRLLAGDLADPEAVRALAAQVHDHTNKLHALAHTAAALTPDRQQNPAGHELMFASNVLGRFLLTHQLLSLLERGAPARVLVVTGPSPDRSTSTTSWPAPTSNRSGSSAPRTPPTCCSPSNWHAACRGRG